MIEIMAESGPEFTLIRIDGHDVKFGTTTFGTVMADISGMRIDYDGVCREHPDLESNPNWKDEAIKRFKKKIKEMKTELEISDYLIEELKTMGYKPKFRQRAGFRREVLNE